MARGLLSPSAMPRRAPLTLSALLAATAVHAQTGDLDAALAQGLTVVLDLRPGAWLGPRQAHVFAEVRAWSETRDHPRVIRWR